MAYEVTIKHAPRHRYRMDIGPTQDAEFPLRQIGPVYNNVVDYRGVFSSYADAVTSALSYFGPGFEIVEWDGKQLEVWPISKRRPQTLHNSYRLIGRNSTAGIFVTTPRP